MTDMPALVRGRMPRWKHRNALAKYRRLVIDPSGGVQPIPSSSTNRGHSVYTGEGVLNYMMPRASGLRRGRMARGPRNQQ